MELLYADDLVLVAETEDLLMVMGKVAEMEEGHGIVGAESEHWKDEGHEVSGEQAVDTGNHPCIVCRKGVGCNSVMCVSYHRWVHRRCSGIPSRLRNNVDLHCWRCSVQKVALKEVEIELSFKMEFVPKFCYLGDINLVPMMVWRRQLELVE